jgi:hypothetical protein
MFGKITKKAREEELQRRSRLGFVNVAFTEGALGTDPLQLFFDALHRSTD